MDDMFFYNGIWRMDWGLGNPNKTAALIAELMVAVWILAYAKKWGFWAALGLFVLLGGCLVHTFSRGGLIAAATGLLPLVIVAPRPRPLKKCAAIGVALLTLFVFALHLDAHKRYGQGVFEEDRSVLNRIEMWKAAPAMMADAPSGWGLGNAGKSYMRWYQPAHNNEHYRTLVNSHLTWLVEVAWPFRFLYILAWFGAMLFCSPTRKSRWRSVALGIWMAFGMAALFSSVAESPWLWIPPAISSALVIGGRIRNKEWPRPAALLIPLVLAALVCAGFLLAGWGRTDISGSKHRVIVGKDVVPSVWLVVDERPLGSYGFARSLRKYLEEKPIGRTIGIVHSFGTLPDELSNATVIVAGAPDGWHQDKMREIADSASKMILLAPCFSARDAGLSSMTSNWPEVIFGEFSQSAHLMSWEDAGNVRRIAGAGDFFHNWPDIVFDD